jgi:hypothetical protein
MLRVLRSEKVRALLPIEKAEPRPWQISALALDQPLVAVRAGRRPLPAPTFIGPNSKGSSGGEGYFVLAIERRL